MKKKDYNCYVLELSSLFKDYAREAKIQADKPADVDSSSFTDGFLMAYHQVIATMKNQAALFDLNQEDVGLSDIDPEKDLL